MKKIKNLFNSLIHDRKGEGFLDVAMKILIVVVIGAAILVIMNTLMPGVFSEILARVSDGIRGVNILP